MNKDETISFLRDSKYLFKEYLKIYLDRFDEFVMFKADVNMPEYNAVYTISTEALAIDCYTRAAAERMVSDMVEIFLRCFLHDYKAGYFEGSDHSTKFNREFD